MRCGPKKAHSPIGSGTAFCAGHDLTEIRAKPGREAFETLFGACSAMMMSILKRWGLPVKGRVVDSLIETIRLNRKRAEFEAACFELNHASPDQVEAFAKKADECYQSLKETIGEFKDESDRG